MQLPGGGSSRRADWMRTSIEYFRWEHKQGQSSDSNQHRAASQPTSRGCDECHGDERNFTAALAQSGGNQRAYFFPFRYSVTESIPRICAAFLRGLTRRTTRRMCSCSNS